VSGLSACGPDRLDLCSASSIRTRSELERATRRLSRLVRLRLVGFSLRKEDDCDVMEAASELLREKCMMFLRGGDAVAMIQLGVVLEAVFVMKV